MLVKKVTEKYHDDTRMFSNSPIEVTTYYLLGIPFRKDFVVKINKQSVK